MALEDNIEADDMLFIGDDKDLRFEIFDAQGPTYDVDGVTITGGTMVDVSTFALRFDVRRDVDDADPPLITKTSAASGGIVVSGTFHASRSMNSQRVVVTLEDIDTDDMRRGNYPFTLKRTDTGNETTLSFGMMTLRRGTVR